MYVDLENVNQMSPLPELFKGFPQGSALLYFFWPG